MSNYKKILFTGSNGRFGKVFKKVYTDKRYLYPSKKVLNIIEIQTIEKYFRTNKPDLVIHCAALSRPMEIHEKDISKSISINIIGTCNLVKVCEKYKVKLIYFSTSYVYPGNKGNYSEKADLKPINNYAWSKLGGECAVQMYKNSLILRICMTENPFVHKQAFKNMKTNFIFHDEVVKMLPLFYNCHGIINIGGKSQSVYSFAKKYNSNVKGVILKSVKDSNLKLNTTMNTNKMKKLLMFKFWSYKREFKKYKKDLLSVISKSIESGTIFFGRNLHTFEKRFNSKYKSRYGIAVGSGTDALLISLKAIGVKNGDEVITAANTAIPTISAIVNTGAKPVFADINEKDYLINVNKIEQKITSKTKAIIPVHLYGQSAEMNQILKISKKYKLHIIEDCAQAQGAKYKNKFVGNFGTFGCFSFYPTKILGAYGDGGFIFTQNYDLYKKIKRIRFYGIETIDKKNNYLNQYYANENGINSRLDEIQSSILNYKLKKVDTAIKRRRQLAKIYLKELKATSLKLPSENKDNKHVYHLFTIYHDKMNKIRILLKKNNIETRVIYPYPVHLMKAYSKFNTTNEKFVNSEKYAKGIFCIPLYPEITDNQAYNLCNKIKIILKKNNI